jgi:hypothetical protein
MTEEQTLLLMLAIVVMVLICIARWPGLVGRPTARCRDGTLSFSFRRQGTCSHHGGVADFYQSDEARA